MMEPPKPVRIIETARAPNPRRVQIFLAEKGVSIPRESIDIMQGEHKTPTHRAFAGAAVVPVLELDDGSTLTETVAICRYLEALYPDPNLMGTDPLEIARIEMWQRRMEFGVLLRVAAIVRHLNPKMAALESPQVPEWGECNRPRLDAAMHDLNQHLQDHAFIASDRFTIADITAVVALDFMRISRTPIPDDCTALQEWQARVQARPSVAL